MKVEVNPTDVDEYKADDRGRVTLGAEYAGENVTAAVIDADGKTETILDSFNQMEQEEYHTTNPTDVKISQKQVGIIDDGGVLLLDHGVCGEAIRLWKEPQEE